MLLRSNKKIKLSIDIKDEDESSNSNWKNLPAKNLQDIFKHLHSFDVENCLRVCRHWCAEANFFLKDKLWLSIHKVRCFEDLTKSKRRFQFLRVIQSKKIDNLERLEANLRFLCQRKGGDAILETRIEYDSYPNLARILQLLPGKYVKTLTLFNRNRQLKLDAERRYNRGLQLIRDSLDYGCLTSVENLHVIHCDNTVLNISRSFGALNSLKLSTGKEEEIISEDLLRNFIDLNPSLTWLNLEDAQFISAEKFPGIYEESLFLLSFQNLKNLKGLCLRTINSNDEIEAV